MATSCRRSKPSLSLIEADALAHHAVDRQLALLVERDEARDVAHRHAASHVAALDGLLLADQPALLEREVGGDRRQARRHRGAAPARHQIGRLHGLDGAGEVEGVVDAAVGEVAHLLHVVGVLGVHRVGGAELAGQAELVVGEIDRDDAAGAGQHRTHQAAQADAAQADDGDRAAGLDLRGVDHGADAGDHGAAEQRRDIERQARVDHHDRAAIDDGVFGVAGDAGLMVHRLAVEMQPMMARQELARGARRDRALADIGPALEAAPAAAAAHVEGEADMVALLDVVHAGADLDDLARALVAQHDRHRPRPVAVDQRQVGMAEPAAAHLDQHLALAGRIEIDLDDMDRLALGERPRRAADRENGGFHLHHMSLLQQVRRGAARFARPRQFLRRHGPASPW